MIEGEENFVGDSEIIALGGASNETKDRPLGYLNSRSVSCIF